MSASHNIEVSGIQIAIVRKDIKHLHLGVYPPHGRVRVAAPVRMDDDAVRLAVISKLGWIRRKQKSYAEQSRQSQRELITGESHYFQGHRYRLDVIEQEAAPAVRLRNNRIMELRIRPDSSTAKRDEVLQRWYRERLRERLPDLLAYWEPRAGVEVAEVRIKKMKTHWGTCNIEARRIWLNLELVKKSPACLEYIMVHEMVHLLERHHNDHFRSLMDGLMPDWRLRRDTLNQSPLSYENWGY